MDRDIRPLADAIAALSEKLLHTIAIKMMVYLTYNANYSIQQ